MKKELITDQYNIGENIDNLIKSQDFSKKHVITEEASRNKHLINEGIDTNQFITEENIRSDNLITEGQYSTEDKKPKKKLVVTSFKKYTVDKTKKKDLVKEEMPTTQFISE